MKRLGKIFYKSLLQNKTFGLNVVFWILLTSERFFLIENTSVPKVM